MPTCEKCWSDARGDLAMYEKLLDTRLPCTPEEQAGPDAKRCPACGRMTLHQHCGKCMNRCPGRTGGEARKGEQVMPSNTVVLNGSIEYEVPDSWMASIQRHLAPWRTKPEGGAPNFEIQVADDCVWLRDIRQGPPLEIHMTRAQAEEVGLVLSAVGNGRQNIEGLRW